MPTATKQVWFFEARVIPEQMGWHVYCPSVFGTDGLLCDGSGNRLQLAGERLYGAILEHLERGVALPDSDPLQVSFMETGRSGTWHVFCLRREDEKLAWWWLEEGLTAIKQFVEGCQAILESRSMILHEVATLPPGTERLQARLQYCLELLGPIKALLMSNRPVRHLRGNLFISKEVESEIGPIPRTCGCCFFGTRDSEPTGRCTLTHKQAHADFAVPPDEPLPRQLDGKEVGHHCRHWLRFDED